MMPYPQGHVRQGKQKLIVHNGHRPPFGLGILCSNCETSDECMYRRHTHLAVDWVDLCI